MQTIQAMVNPRLLIQGDPVVYRDAWKAGSLRSCKTPAVRAQHKVEITNHDEHVTVRDNGEGIDDFSRLLDLGGSGWEETLESSEDPAGVGLFCLAPRQVTIRSNGQIATISDDGWTGTPVEIQRRSRNRTRNASAVPGRRMDFGCS